MNKEIYTKMSPKDRLSMRDTLKALIEKERFRFFKKIWLQNLEDLDQVIKEEEKRPLFPWYKTEPLLLLENNSPSNN